MAKRTAKTSKKVAPGKKSAMDVLVAYMNRNPKAVYADAQAACLKAGHKVYPIMWGRAQVMLGRVAARPKGSRAEAKISTAKRGPGRPRKEQVRASDGIVVPVNNLNDLVAWQQLVAGLNGGRKVALQYDGQKWLLAVL